MTSCFGLPRAVIQLFQYMEVHKDCLKWHISGSSHKISLTLHWNVGKYKGKESLWHKFERAIKVKGEDGAKLPQNLTDLLQYQISPKRQIRRSASYRASMHPTPKRVGNGDSSRHNHIYHDSTCSNAQKDLLPNDMTYEDSFHSVSDMTPTSPRFSWPVVMHETLELDPQSSSTPNRSTTLTRSQSTASARTPTRLTYRTEEEIESSLEDIMEKTREETRQKLDSIREYWTKSLSQWPGVDSSSENSDSEQTIRKTRITVQKCLDSCDKILQRNSTDIS